jgi:predicted enzyme related to lactoylglutathione lyase
VSAIPGSVCWAARLSSDLDPVATFYEAVMGWTSSPVVIVEEDYRIAHAGQPGPHSAQAGLDSGSLTAKLPSVWLVHLIVDDAGEAVRRAQRYPAAEVLLQRAVPHLGELAVVRDPTGLPVALWAPTPGSAGHPANTQWNAAPYSELWSTAPASTAEFIAAVVGQQVTRVPDANELRERWVVGEPGLTPEPVLTIRDTALVPALTTSLWLPFLECAAVAVCLTSALAQGGDQLPLHPAAPEAGALRLGWCRDAEGVPVGFAARH